jgi:hypothetical protein
VEVLVILRKLLRFSCRLLVAFLVAYWVIFAFYSIEQLIVGGPQEVVGWYQHISSRLIPTNDGRGGVGFRVEPWGLGAFLARQVLVLTITVALAVPVFCWKKQSRFAS